MRYEEDYEGFGVDSRLAAQLNKRKERRQNAKSSSL